MTVLAGIDIGGTKCAVCLGVSSGAKGEEIRLIDRFAFPTKGGPEAVLARLAEELERLLAKNGFATPAAVGVSCGGPLDSRRGLALSPPNLPSWDRIDVLKPFRQRFGAPVALQNDANACALAEWKWGAGRGAANVVFLTFGTGMGAGLILNGRLYTGTNDMAGEIGHVRLEPDGPVGYGKAGSFEGYCSGAGIAQLAREAAAERLARGEAVAFCPRGQDIPSVTAQAVAEAAHAGDELAREIYRFAGRQLGRGLAILVDLLNPERIVIGSIYARQRELLESAMTEALASEGLPLSLSACRIVPAELNERVGDYAGLSIAEEAWNANL